MNDVSGDLACCSTAATIAAVAGAQTVSRGDLVAVTLLIAVMNMLRHAANAVSTSHGYRCRDAVLSFSSRLASKRLSKCSSCRLFSRSGVVAAVPGR